MRLEKKTQTSGNGRSWRVGPSRLIGRLDSTLSKSPLGESQTKSGRLVDPPLLWPGAQVEPGRLVDPGHGSGKGRPQGPRVHPRAATSPLLSSPCHWDQRGRDTCAHGGDGRDRARATSPPAPLAPPGKGDGGAALRRPRTRIRATPLPPHPPSQPAGEGPRRGSGGGARHPEAGRRRQGRPRLLPLSLDPRAHPHRVEGGGPPAARGQAEPAEGEEREGGTDHHNAPAPPAGRQAGATNPCVEG